MVGGGLGKQRQTTHLGVGASLYKDPNLYWRLLARRLQLTWHGPWHPRRQWPRRGDDRTGIGVNIWIDCGAALMLRLERALNRLLVFRYS